MLELSPKHTCESTCSDIASAAGDVGGDSIQFVTRHQREVEVAPTVAEKQLNRVVRDYERRRMQIERLTQALAPCENRQGRRLL